MHITGFKLVFFFFFLIFFYLDKSKSVNKFCFKKIKLKPLNNSVEKMNGGLL